MSRPAASSLRRAAVVGAAFLIVVLSCGPDITGPAGGVRYARGVSFNPVFPAALANLSAGVVDFTHVRVVLSHSDATPALDTVIDFPAGADTVAVSLNVPLDPDAPLTGEVLSMTLAYINALGDTVFRGGPVSVTLRAGAPGQVPPPVIVPVAYVGTGANAVSVAISPRSIDVLSGAPFTFTAVALDGQGVPIPGTPIAWKSQDPTIATITSPSAGAGVAQNGHGTATIVAQLLTGPSDAVSVNVSGAATHLAFSVQPGNIVSGGTIAPAIVVQALDAGGLVATSFTGNISLGFGTNPSAATLGGTLTQAAVAGVATFSNITIGPLGVGYTLVASATGLTSATSTAFNVTLGAAANIVADSGQGQTAPASTTLATQLVVRVTDANSNPVPGTPVTWAVATGGGALISTTSTTDVNGRARTGWVLGSLLGAQSVTATSAGLTGSPITFTANASATLVNFTWTGATNTSWSTATNWSPAGVPGGTDSVRIVLTANQPLISAAASVKHLYMNAGTSMTTSAPLTVNGNLSVPATAAIVNNSTIAVAGNVDASGAINIATGTVNFTGAAAQTLKGTIGSRMNFNGTGPYTLTGLVSTGALLSVNSGDLNLNGQTLIASAGMRVGTGGVGTLTMTTAGSALTVVGGNLSFQGASETGKLTTGTITFGGPSLDASITPINVGSGLTLTFNGSAAQTYVCAGCNLGAIVVNNAAGVSGPQFVATGGVTITSGVLTVSGALGISTTLTDAVGGRVVATSVDFTGAVPVATSTPSIASPVTFSASTSIGGNLAVSGNLSVLGGVLSLGGRVMTTTGNFSTSGTGAISMTNPADSLRAFGNATFAGGATTGLITAGNLVVDGAAFSATGAAFDASGTHTTTFSGTVAQTLTWNSAIAGKGFNNVTFRNAGSKTFSGNQTIVGSVLHTLGSGHVAGSFTITIGGNVTDQTTTRDAWNGSSSVILTGAPTVLPRHFGVNTLTFSGGSAVLSDSLFTGFIIIDGLTAELQLNGHYVRTAAGFTTQNGGVVTMTNVRDTLDVVGNGVFNGGSTAGRLKRGYMNLGGFSQGGNAAAFSADSTLRTSIGRGLASTITFANPGFGAGLSHFGELMIGDGSTHTLNTNVFVEGQLTTNPGGGVQFPVTSANLLITARGMNANHLFLTNTRVLLLDGSPVTQASDVQFLAPMDPTATQFEVQRSGIPGTGDFGATLLNPVFNVTPTTGLYIKATDTDGALPFLTLTVSGALPVAHLGFASALSGAIINGWLANLTLTFNVASGPWNVASNWSPAQVPTANDNVVIPTGRTASLTAAGAIAHDLTLVGTGTLAQANFDINVMGNIVTDPAQGGITCVGSTDISGITIQPATSNTTRFVQGRLCRYQGAARIQASGNIVATNVFHVRDSTFTFAGHSVQTKEAWVGTLPGSTGALVMTNPLDSLLVSDSLWVGDPSSTSTKVSTLTNGVIAIIGDFRQVGGPGKGYFSATGAHLTTMAGGAAAPRFINFTDSTASGFANFTVTSNGVQVPAGVVARVNGNLILKSGALISGGVGRLIVAGSLFAAPGTSITANNFQIAGVLSDTGTFSPDTTVFSGASQIIPDSLAPGLGGFNYKSIRVTGNATMQPIPSGSAYFLSGKLIVDGGQLRIGTGAAVNVNVSDSLITKNGGTLKMIDAQSLLSVSGNAVFAGGSTAGLLTAGQITLTKNFAQVGALASFAPSGSHITNLSGSAQTITFATPATNFFQTLNVGATTVTLASNVTVVGALNHSPTLTTITSGATTLMTIGGLSNAGTGGLTFSNTQVKLTDGPAITLVNNVSFGGFALGSPLTFFEIARTTGGATTFGSLTFSGTLGTTGRYVVNSGNTAVSFGTITPRAASAPSTCGCTIFSANTGTGSLTWQ